MPLTAETTAAPAVTYPCLMKSWKSAGIVLFAARRVGMVVLGKDSKLGCYRADWHMEDFEPYFGSVTLTQTADLA